MLEIRLFRAVLGCFEIAVEEIKAEVSDRLEELRLCCSSTSTVEVVS
jgi:hypothetical protein